MTRVRRSIRPAYRKRPPAARAGASRVPPILHRRQPITQSIDNLFAASLLGVQLTPQSQDRSWDWDAWDLGRQTLTRMSPQRLMETLADTSPEVSRALWDALRFSNPGWTYRAIRRRGSDQTVKRGNQVLDAFFARLSANYGAPDVVFNRLFIGAWLRGALLAELVFDEDGRTGADIATPDPASVRFVAREDPIRGIVWVPHQQQQAEIVAIDGPTVRYIPIDPLPGKPYGRSPLHPALYASLFLLGMLHDIKRVVSQQGWPRIDIEVDLEKLRAGMPDDVADSPDGMRIWVQSVIDQVSAVYSQLEPDDAYIHTNEVAVNPSVGAVNSYSMAGLDNIIKIVERMIVRALKTVPLLLGITDGVSEANSNRQFEIYTTGVKSVQNLAEKLIEALLDQLLQAAGVAAVAEFRFDELRASEALRDAQTRGQQITNWSNMVKAGWASPNEAAQDLLGHDADRPVAAPVTVPDSPAAPASDSLTVVADGAEPQPATDAPSMETS